MSDDDYEWEEPDEPVEAVPGPPLNEPRSRTRKFVYLVVALLPFVAFILMLPRGGDAPEEEVEPEPTMSPAGITSTTGVQLAFPFGMSPPPPLVESPSPAENFPLEAPGTTQCSDGIDNDRDGRVDLADSGCSGSRDNTESPNPARRTTPPPPPPPVMPPPPPELPIPEPPPTPTPPAPTQEPTNPPPPIPTGPPPSPYCEPPFEDLPGCPGREQASGSGN